MSSITQPDSSGKMKIRFFTFEAYHGKRGIGSTKIRVHNLINNWKDAALYQYGEKPDVLIYQKVYGGFDYKLPFTFPVPKILDICDPDFKDTPDIYVKETMDHMSAVVVPTQPFKDFLSQMTETPIYVVKDRFDIDEFPEPKQHSGDAATVVWFGYSHNAASLKLAMPSIEKRNLKLIVISDSDPAPYKMCIDAIKYRDEMYSYVRYNQQTVYNELQKADICVLPPNNRPFDVFKSENKTVIAELCGIPVATNAEELDALMTAKARNEHIKQNYDKLKHEYDCKRSVEEYKTIISEISKK